VDGRWYGAATGVEVPAGAVAPSYRVSSTVTFHNVPAALTHVGHGRALGKVVIEMT
jgi:hypothetical protein